MRPILYESNEEKFTSNGLGRPEFTECTVTQKADYTYELAASCYVGSKHAEDLTIGRLIYAKPDSSSEPEPFQIYAIEKDESGLMRVSAEHISYRMKGNPCKPFSLPGSSTSTVKKALDLIYLNRTINDGFSYITDLANISAMKFEKPQSVYDVLLYIAKQYGEKNILFTKKTAKVTIRGKDSGLVIRYGKNVSSINQSYDITGKYTGVIAYWEREGTYKYSAVQYVPGSSSWPYQAIYAYDVSTVYTGTDQTTLNSYASAYIAEHRADFTPAVSITIGYVDTAAAANTAISNDTPPASTLSLFDSVHVVYEPLGIETTAQVVTTEWDVLRDRYTKIEIGTPKTTITEAIKAVK